MNITTTGNHTDQVTYGGSGNIQTVRACKTYLSTTRPPRRVILTTGAGLSYAPVLHYTQP